MIPSTLHHSVRLVHVVRNSIVSHIDLAPRSDVARLLYVNTKMATCPCGLTETGSKPSGTGRHDPRASPAKEYATCCGRYLDGGEAAPTAEALMRSRYTAYTLRREDYLLQTWHSDTRPASLGLEDETDRKWLELEIKRHEQPEPGRALVEFVARYKVAGRAHRLHEVSRFVREAERWLYVDGDIRNAK